MLVTEFVDSHAMKPLKFSARYVPHVTIETNRTCNMQCRSCYTLEKAFVKDLNDIKKEIDLAVSKRKLETITLLGGEPTIHKDIADIVSYVKEQKIVCQLLTNGRLFLGRKGDLLLNSLLNAGIDRIILHIDIGQECSYRYIMAIREKLFSSLERKKTHFSLALTIYDDNKNKIPEFISLYAKYSFFDGILAIIARDGKEPLKYSSCISDEYRYISNALALEPSTYVPSNLNDEYISWLIYYYFINADSGKTFAISPLVCELYGKLYRLVRGHHMFSMRINSKLHKLMITLTCLLEMIFFPDKIAAAIRVFCNLFRVKSPIRFHYIVIQNPPEIDECANVVQFCYHCPDATIRNGQLIPVCLADYISPLSDDLKYTLLPKVISRKVSAHLAEKV